jgi:hypothetical protein
MPCYQCGDRGNIPCPGAHCSHGTVPSRRGGVELCGTCHGAGHVPCPACGAKAVNGGGGNWQLWFVAGAAIFLLCLFLPGLYLVWKLGPIIIQLLCGIFQNC